MCAVATVAVVSVGIGCSGDDTAPSGTATSGSVVVPGGSGPAGTNVQSATALPRVGDIRPAIDAVERELGGPQRFFEVLATPALVNLFVAVNDGAAVQPYVYLEGKLVTGPGQAGAGGATFAGSAVQFHADTMFDDVRASLKESVIEAFEVVGGPNGAIRYTAVIRSPTGSQLLAVLDASGKTLAVDKPGG